MDRREFINSVMIGGSLCAAPSFYSCEVNQSKDGSPLCIDYDVKMIIVYKNHFLYIFQ